MKKIGMRLRLGLTTIVFVSISIAMHSQNVEDVGKQFANSMCSCIEKQLDGEQITSDNWATYFEYCKGYAWHSLKDEFAKIDSTSEDLQENLAKALSTNLLSDCPILLPIFVGVEVNNRVREECEKKLIPLLEAEAYSGEICSCFTDTYIGYLGKVISPAAVIKSGKGITVDPKNLITLQAATHCVNKVALKTDISFSDAYHLSCHLMKMRLARPEDAQKVDMEKVCDCTFNKLEDYILENPDVSEEELPKDLDWKIFNSCFEGELEKK